MQTLGEVDALTWHPVGPAEDVSDGTLRRAEIRDRAVCIGRLDGSWVAFDDTCTHEECSLSDGELDGTVVVCPCHGSEFDIRTGDVLCPPALEPLPIYETREEEGTLLVRLAPPAAAAEAVHEREDHVSAAVARLATVAAPSLEGIVLDDVDLTDLDVWEQQVPHDWLTLLRREAPLHWHPEHEGRGFWVFTRYDDIVEVSKDWETYSSELGGTSLQDLTPEEIEARKSMLDTDPPAHTRLRAIVNKGFTPRVVNTYEERIRGLARGILEQALRRDELDWVGDVAAEIPMWVFSEIMGLPVEDRKLLIELGDKLLGNSDPEVVGEENVAERALSDPELRKLPFSSPFALDLIEYGCKLGEARRHEPRDDITTKLVEADVDGSKLSEREFGVFFILLTTAGNETTRHTISLGLLDLLEHPEERARLVADPSLAGTAADEILRRAHPVHHFRRTATRDVTVHGRRIKAGDKVTFWYASGNYDEDRFPDPFRLDVGRTPNRHLTFGLGGPHFCLGAHLAKLEVKIWLEEMIPYLERLELAGAPMRLRSNMFNGIKRMPVRVAS
jgi:cytochrome P450/nitrite reductase/ring-hydroxylating ferredoxin subunit